MEKLGKLYTYVLAVRNYNIEHITLSTELLLQVIRAYWVFNIKPVNHHDLHVIIKIEF